MEVTYNRGESSKGTSSKDYTENCHVIQQFHFCIDTQRNLKQGIDWISVHHIQSSMIHQSQKMEAGGLLWWSSG